LSNCQIESVCHFVTNLGQRLEILLNDTYVLRIEGNTGTCSGPKTVFETCNGEGALEQITLYPNPVVTGFELSDWAAIRRLEVYALSGEIVQSREVQGLVDLSHLPTGLYVVSIVSNSDQSRQIKIIKQ
ncbi:MAG: T9SS type A sorting domain-containing protein, partial [Bacteroidota bacterium]